METNVKRGRDVANKQKNNRSNRTTQICLCTSKTPELHFVKRATTIIFIIHPHQHHHYHHHHQEWDFFKFVFILMKINILNCIPSSSYILVCSPHYYTLHAAEVCTKHIASMQLSDTKQKKPTTN